MDDTSQIFTIFSQYLKLPSLLFTHINDLQANYKKTEVIFQITAKITSACIIRPIGMTYRLLNVFVYSYGHTEIYAVSRFKLFLCVHLKEVFLLDEIFSVSILCNLIFWEIPEWFIMRFLGVTDCNVQCHGRGQDAASTKQCVSSSQICWGGTDCKCTWMMQAYSEKKMNISIFHSNKNNWQ